MSIKQISTIAILSVTLVGCQWAYEQENIFDGHLSTQAERDNEAIKRGENPMDRPSYDEYKETMDKSKLGKDSILP